MYFQILEGGAREALQDIISKVLLKTANQPEGKEEQIDDSEDVEDPDDGMEFLAALEKHWRSLRSVREAVAISRAMEEANQEEDKE